MKNHLFSPLKTKEYRRFYLVQLFSDLGNWFDFTILIVLITYKWGLDESAMASFIIVYGLPWVLIGPFASVFVDRWPRKKVLMTTLFLRIVVVLAYMLSPNLMVLLLFVFCKGVLASLFAPAQQASIRTLAPPSRLSEAVALTQISANTMKIIGPSLSGFLVATFSISIALMIEALCFAIATVGLLWIIFPQEKYSPVLHAKSKEKKTHQYIQELQEGFKHIQKNLILSTAIMISAISLFIVFLYDGLLVFVSKEIGFSETYFGLLISLVGIGSVIGSLLLGQFVFWKQKPLTTMIFSFSGSGFLIVLMGLGTSHFLYLPSYMWFLCAFVVGVFTCSQNIPYGYILQVETPSQKMGRVSSVAQSIQTFMMLLASPIGALLAKKIGVGNVFIIAGCMCFIATIVVFIFIKIKKREMRSAH